MKDKKTTISGVSAAIGVLAMSIAAATDNDPETVLDVAGAIQAIGALLAVFGLGKLGIGAKDKD